MTFRAKPTQRRPERSRADARRLTPDALEFAHA
jgi:hypothetical protein